MARPQHPDKEIESALVELERLGWVVSRAKDRSAHAWGFALCPANAGGECRSGVFCRMQVWTTPRNPVGHARGLVRNARGCVIARDDDHG